MKNSIPQPVLDVIDTLNQGGFEAFVVGGCVRDLLLGRTPKDWDVTTDATPDQVLALFPESFYENDFGTVGVKVPRFSLKPRTTHDEPSMDGTPMAKEEKEIIEVTTYRIESEYTDLRRPKEVIFTKSLEEDLARRDFTINAIAFGVRESGIRNQESGNSEMNFVLLDPFDGQADLKKKIIRTVGDPEERFGEDALRLMRAVRFWAELRDPAPFILKPEAKEYPPASGWRIETATFDAIRSMAGNIKAISQERIRDELSKIVLSASPADGIEMLHHARLLPIIIPELEEGVGVAQNLHHIYTVWEHNLRALATCPSPKLSVRLAALLHDVGKPRSKRGEGYRSTFYNHDHIGARMTDKILTRLRYPKTVIAHATLLVDNHLFYYNVGEVTEASVRRLIRRVGLENMDDLMAVRIGDRLGSGVPKAKPYRLRHLEYMIDKVSRDPVSVKMLTIKGNDLMETLALPAGPLIGAILDVLLAEVIEDPTKNVRETLLGRGNELRQHAIDHLRALAKERIEERREEDDRKIKKGHWVE